MRAFSLAELMIALVILGFGLLVVGAALPVGLTYTRQSLDLDVAESAAADAFQQIESQIRMAISLDNGIVPPADRPDNLFRPRENTGGASPAKALLPPKITVVTGGTPRVYAYDPKIKVRPLVLANIEVGTNPMTSKTDTSEDLINKLLGLSSTTPDLWEADYDSTANNTSPSLFRYPGMSAVARVYPPITPDDPFLVKKFTGANRYKPAPVTVAEMRKAGESRVAWTAFYRRVSYDADSDPTLYEVLVAVAQRPTVQHRFARQDRNGSKPFETPRAVAPNDVNGSELLAPSPWLVTFTKLPQPPAYDIVNPALRIPKFPGGIEPQTLAFTCTAQVGELLPVGSVFIPARNDFHNTTAAYDSIPDTNPSRKRPVLVGFSPHAPTILPVYEVVERPDATTVVVKSNGYYPWVNTAAGGTAADWPVWVIPPAFDKRYNDASKQPVYEKRSPILTLARRYVHFREVQ